MAYENNINLRVKLTRISLTSEQVRQTAKSKVEICSEKVGAMKNTGIIIIEWSTHLRQVRKPFSASQQRTTLSRSSNCWLLGNLALELCLGVSLFFSDSVESFSLFFTLLQMDIHSMCGQGHEVASYEVEIVAPIRIYITMSIQDTS